MVKYCLNCGYDLSKVNVSVAQAADVIENKPKKVAKKVIQEETSEEEEQEETHQEEILRKVAQKLVIKTNKNGQVDIKTRASDKQYEGLQKARDTRNKKMAELKQQSGKPTYTYPKVAAKKAEKEAIETPKEQEPKSEPPKEPPKNYYNPYSNIF